MNNTPVPESVCQARQQVHAERLARDKERLERNDELLAKVSECQIQLTEMVKHHDEKLNDHEKRLDEIEHQPKVWWDKIISGVIAAVVAFVMGMILK